MSDDTPDMPDGQRTSEQAPVLPDYERMHRDYIVRLGEANAINKALLFDALAAAGITAVLVNFDGYGDSGQIESIEAKAGGQAAEVPDKTLEFLHPVWHKPEIERRNHTIPEAIEELVYAFLRQTHDGWENNDGAYGEFTFDLDTRTITLDYNERYTSSENYTHEF